MRLFLPVSILKHRGGISCLVGHENGKNVVQVEKGKYNITEEDLWPLSVTALESSIMVLNNLSAVVLYVTSRVSHTSDMRPRAKR